MAQEARSPELLKHLAGITPQELEEFAKEHGLPPAEVEDIAWWLANGWKYKFRPVSVREFLTSRTYLRDIDEHGRPLLWPRVMEAVEAICSGRYVEAVLTGGIGTAKTTIALRVQAYKLYEMLCMHSPHAVYGLDPSTEILVVFQSLDLKTGRDVAYSRFRSMCEKAPIFSQTHFQFNRDLESRMEFRSSITVQPISGRETGAIGQNVIGGMIDEVAHMARVEKSARRRDSEVYDQAVELYEAIERRRTSRFMDQGELAGMLCLVGSKRYPGDFLHRKIDEARDAPERIYLYDEVLWHVAPDKFGGQKFRVFQGDSSRKPRVMEESEAVSDADARLVVEVPTEYREAFRRDIIGALRDIAGVASISLHPFMLDRDAIAEAFGRVKSIASRPDCDFVDYQLQVHPSRWMGSQRYPRFGHLDLSRTRDSAGVAICHVPGFKRMRRTEAVVELWPVIKYDLLLEVRPPRSGEINYEKIRRLLYLLRERGLPIRWVTCDQYMSTDMQQILAQHGFITGEESTDKWNGPYDLLKSAIYDRRVLAPDHPKALSELVHLEVDPKPAKPKVDHPPDGSKDVADAMACAAYGISTRGEVWSSHGIDVVHVPPTLHEMASRANAREAEGSIGN